MLSELGKHIAEVAWELAVESNKLTSTGVYEPQRFRMQTLPSKLLEYVFKKGLPVTGGRSVPDVVAAIHGIAQHRMADMRHVHTNLMRTTRFEPHLAQRKMIEILEHLVMRNGPFPVIFADNRHHFAVAL